MSTLPRASHGKVSARPGRSGERKRTWNWFVAAYSMVNRLLGESDGPPWLALRTVASSFVARRAETNLRIANLTFGNREGHVASSVAGRTAPAVHRGFA